MQPSELTSTISQCQPHSCLPSKARLLQSLSETTEGIRLPPVRAAPRPPVIIGIQHFEKRALSEVAGAQNVSTQHNDAVFIGFRGRAELWEGEGGVDLLTPCRRPCLTTPSTQEGCKTQKKPLPPLHITQFL